MAPSPAIVGGYREIAKEAHKDVWEGYRYVHASYSRSIAAGIRFYKAQADACPPSA